MADEWLTYQQAAERFGNSPEAIRRHARRHGWRTQRANDGHTLLLIPDKADAGGRARPGGYLLGDAGELVGELRRRAETAEAWADALNGELIIERERRARAEGEAAAYRVNFENALGRAERAEARAEREAQAATEGRQQVTDATVKASLLEAERDAARAAAEAAQVARAVAERERAELVIGGPFGRVWRAFRSRQTPGTTTRDIAIGAAWGSVAAFLIWAMLR